MHFDRIELKSRAKEVLLVKYWPFFLMGILQYIVAMTFTWNINVNDLKNVNNIPMFMGLLGTGFVFSIIIGIFLKNPLTVAICRFMVVNSENDGVNYSVIADIFKNGYLNIVKGTFLKGLLLFIYEAIMVAGVMIMWMASALFASGVYLGGMLCIVMGFVVLLVGFVLYINRSYAYYMVEFLLAENSEMGAGEVIRTSKEMMQGVKLETFILSLSFLGWQILGTMLCGIGILFVVPYQQATFTQLYIKLRDEKLNGYKII